MRFLYVMVVFMSVGLAADAQSILDKKVSLTIQNESLESALYTLIDEADVNISFSNSILPFKIINYEVKDQPLKYVLNQWLFGTDLDYSLNGQVLVIFKPVKNKHTISGYVTDASSGESMVGAVVYEKISRAGAYSNEFGYYSLTLEEGFYDLVYSSLGYESDTISINLNKNRRIEVPLQTAYLTQIVVNSISDSILLDPTVGGFSLNMKQVSRLTSLGGEPDVMRIAYTLPGFQTGADGFGGLAVRGGNVDQNLFLLDGVPIYNASHGLGIYSVYNSSAIKSAKILKGAFPARYGGRISSYWDIQTKEGNYNNFTGETDIGLSSAKLTMEGPINKGDGSFFFSGRRSFFDYFSEPITRSIRENKGLDGYIRYYFFDLNLKMNYRVSEKDRVFVSYYRGRDFFNDILEQNQEYNDSTVFLLDEENVFWGNTVTSLRWNHEFSERLFGNGTFTYSRYLYESQDLIDLNIAVADAPFLQEVVFQKYSSKIQDKALKLDFDYFANNKHFFKFGINATWHEFRAGINSIEEQFSVDAMWRDTLGDASRLPLESAEFDAYIEDEIAVNEFIKANIGFRASALSVNDVWYFSPQPRLHLSILPLKDWTFNMSASRVTQFLHLLSPSSLGLPKDLWVSATETIAPQYSWQFTTGIEKRLPKGLKVSLEGYYKTMKNLLIFKGSTLDNVTTVNWDSRVSVGKGYSYGVEFLLQKQTTKWSGWFGYTWSKSFRQFSEEVNQGRTFPTRFDRRHNLNLQLLYNLNRKWSFALGATYTSGAPFSLPTQTYRVVQAPGSTPIGVDPISSPITTEINSFRLPAYHRVDLSANYILPNTKNRQELKFGVYNVYSRQNPLYITLRDTFKDNGTLRTEFVKVSLLPIFPTLRYIVNFK